MAGPRVLDHFAIVRGANNWRVLEFVGYQKAQGIEVPQYRYATDPLKSRREAVRAIVQLIVALQRGPRVINPLEDE